MVSFLLRCRRGILVCSLSALSTLFYFPPAFPQNFPGNSNAPQATFEISNDPEEIIVSYTQALSEMGGGDKGPSVTVYADGHVIVEYPPFMKNAGEYTLQLSQVEMDRLLRSLVDKKVMEFDPQAIRRSKREARAAEKGVETTLYGVSDAPTTIIEIRLSRYTGAGLPAQEQLNVNKKISWHGLGADARNYPGIKAIQDLHAAQKDLHALMNRKDLKKKNNR